MRASCGGCHTRRSRRIPTRRKRWSVCGKASTAVKVWTNTRPWNFEGQFTHRRAVNVWPRPYQTPHPPVWVTGSSDVGSVRRAAAAGYVFATFLQPYPQVTKLFDAYRDAYLDNGQPGGGGLAFMPLMYVGDTEAEAEAGARELAWYLAARSSPSSAIRRATCRSDSSTSARCAAT